jgi:predicted nucleic acid-binding Zn ribbon protein
MPFTSLSGLLGHSAKKRGIASQVEGTMVLEFFKQIAEKLFGAEAAASMRPLHVKDAVLTVAVLSPTAAQELKVSETKIVEYVNQKAGRTAVQRILFLS